MVQGLVLALLVGGCVPAPPLQTQMTAQEALTSVNPVIDCEWKAAARCDQHPVDHAPSSRSRQRPGHRGAPPSPLPRTRELQGRSLPRPHCVDSTEALDSLSSPMAPT